MIAMRRVLFFIIAILCAARSASAGAEFSHSTVSVAATSTVVVAASSTRLLLILENDSDTVMYCNLAGGAAVLNTGTRLSANGGGKVLDVRAPSTAVACIHGGSGTKNLLVTY